MVPLPALALRRILQRLMPGRDIDPACPPHLAIVGAQTRDVSSTDPRIWHQHHYPPQAWQWPTPDHPSVGGGSGVASGSSSTPAGRPTYPRNRLGAVRFGRPPPGMEENASGAC